MNLADETPTPIRFIRNCEEVGLFQDLQHVNPFDEQFRRASEVVPIPGSTNVIGDDVLHTPHVFPIEPESALPPEPSHSLKSSSIRKSYLMPPLSTPGSLHLPSPLPTSTPLTITEPTRTPVSSSNSLAVSVNRKSITSYEVQRKEKYRKLSPHSNHKPPLLQPANVGVNIMPRPASDIPSLPAHDPLLQILFHLPDGQLVQIPATLVPTETEHSTVNSDSKPVLKPVLSETKEVLALMISSFQLIIVFLIEVKTGIIQGQINV